MESSKSTSKTSSKLKVHIFKFLKQLFQIIYYSKLFNYQIEIQDIIYLIIGIIIISLKTILKI